jgi:cytidine deaminase
MPKVTPLPVVLLASTIALVLAERWRRRSASKLERDDVYLQRAHQLRLALTKPAQSRFRVVAFLVFADGSVIPGANDEPSPTISGAICAERGAFLQLRLQERIGTTMPLIEKIYIVTDATTPIPPGILCREYMYGHPSVKATTTFVLQSEDASSEPWIVDLQEMYPHPTLYMKLSVDEILEKGKEYGAQLKNAPLPTVPGLKEGDLKELLSKASRAAQQDDREEVHPIRYGAAAVMRQSDRSLRYCQAAQRKTLEYGASQDAVAQLDIFDNASGAKVVLAVVLVDHMGVLHPPFAPARSLLVEHGLGDTMCLIPVPVAGSSELNIQAITARELAPFAPEFK